METAVKVSNEVESRGLQAYLFEKGYKWVGDVNARYTSMNALPYCIKLNSSKLLSCAPEDWYINRNIQVINISDWDKIKSIVSYLPKKITLNSSHTAEVDKSTKTVKVGCQSFTFDKIKELYEATI